jgi:hypothetical protein
MKKLLLFMLTLCAAGTLFAQTIIYNGIYYKITSPTTVEVTVGNQVFIGAAIIPSTVTNASITYSVTGIGNEAFMSSSSLTSITIPTSVTSIGIYAFKQCTSLTSITIPNSVTSIKSSAFEQCLTLTSVSIGNSVTDMGDYAFRYCSGLISVSMGNSVTSIGAGAFHGCTRLTSVSIPNSVTNIGNEAFYYCGVLNSVSMGNSVTNIGQGAFENCVKLTSITIPSSVTSIGDYAFASCNSLTMVTVNWATPLSINANVFNGLNLSTKTLNVPASTETAYKAALVWKEFGTITEQAVLPLTLTSLTAKAIATGNQINWATANVINVKNLTLERSGADKNFSALITLPISVTTFIDTNPLTGDNYYRLSSIDNDGSINTYDKVAFVKGLTKPVSVYPNPVTNGQLNIIAGNQVIKSITLINLSGVKVINLPKVSNPKAVVINTGSLVKGVYVLEITNGESTTVKKIVVN